MPYQWQETKRGRRYIRYFDTPPAAVAEHLAEVIGSKPLALADWTKADLVKLAKDRSVDASGTKAELLERLNG